MIIITKIAELKSLKNRMKSIACNSEQLSGFKKALTDLLLQNTKEQP